SGSTLDTALPYVATLAASFSVVYSLRFIHGALFGPPPTDLPRQPPDVPSWMVAPVVFLVAACLLVGIFPAATAGPFLDVAVRSVLGTATPEYSLQIWHGFTVPLLMSFAALVGGTLLYVALVGYLRRGIEGPPLLRRFNSLRLFDQSMVFLCWRAARAGVELLGSRRLQPQLRVLMVMVIAAACWPLYEEALRVGPIGMS